MLGILGGMGPAASSEFLRRLIEQTPATCDQEHIPTVLWSDPTIPDRSTALRTGTDEPLEGLLRGIRGLKAAGCTQIVIPCNTAHFWYDQMVDQGVPILHIVESVSMQLNNLNVTGTVGIMGTQSTIEFGLYQDMLGRRGWDCIVPSQYEMDVYVQPAIDHVKAGNIAAAQPTLNIVIKNLIDRGAEAVVLGCTELPLAVPETEMYGVPLINSIDSLVKSTLEWYQNDPK